MIKRDFKIQSCTVAVTAYRVLAFILQIKNKTNTWNYNAFSYCIKAGRSQKFVSALA